MMTMRMCKRGLIGWIDDISKRRPIPASILPQQPEIPYALRRQYCRRLKTTAKALNRAARECWKFKNEKSFVKKI